MQRDLAFIVSEKLDYIELFNEITKHAGKDLIDIKSVSYTHLRAHET